MPGDAHLLKHTSKAWKRTEAAPHAPDKKPAQNNGRPPHSPGQEEYAITIRVLWTKKPSQDYERKYDVTDSSAKSMKSAPFKDTIKTGKDLEKVYAGVRIPVKKYICELFKRQ